MPDPEMVSRAHRAAAALEQAWERWRVRHGLAGRPMPPVSSYVGYSIEEPWGSPRVVFGVDAREAEVLAALLDSHEYTAPPAFREQAAAGGHTPRDVRGRIPAQVHPAESMAGRVLQRGDEPGTQSGQAPTPARGAAHQPVADGSPMADADALAGHAVAGPADTGPVAGRAGGPAAAGPVTVADSRAVTARAGGSSDAGAVTGAVAADTSGHADAGAMTGTGTGAVAGGAGDAAVLAGSDAAATDAVVGAEPDATAGQEIPADASISAAADPAAADAGPGAEGAATDASTLTHHGAAGDGLRADHHAQVSARGPAGPFATPGEPETARPARPAAPADQGTDGSQGTAGTRDDAGTGTGHGADDLELPGRASGPRDLSGGIATELAGWAAGELPGQASARLAAWAAVGGVPAAGYRQPGTTSAGAGPAG